MIQLSATACCPNISPEVSSRLVTHLLLLDLHVGLALALLVLEGAVEQEDAGLLNAPPHLGVRHVLVEHDTVDHTAVRQLATGDLKKQRTWQVSRLRIRSPTSTSGQHVGQYIGQGVGAYLLNAHIALGVALLVPPTQVLHNLPSHTAIEHDQSVQ